MPSWCRPVRQNADVPAGAAEARQLRDALDESVLRGLRPLTTAMILVYLVLATAHLMVLPAAMVIPMTAAALATVLVLAGVRAALTRKLVPLAGVQPLVACLVGLALFNSLLHLYLSGEPQHTTNLMLVLIGASFFLMSRIWFLACLGITLLCWGGLAAAAPAAVLWGHFGFALFMTSVMALLIHVVQRRRLLRLEGLRLRNEQRNAELEAEIAERKRAEEQMHRYQVEMAHIARLCLAGEMAAGLAHELNQPLTAIAVSSDACLRLLQYQDTDRAQVLRVLGQIGQQSQRAGEIIRRMKNFTRKTEPRRVPMDINGLIREVAGFSAVELHRHRIKLGLDLAAGLPPVPVDGIQIQQVLLNLLRNGMESIVAAQTVDRRLLIRSRMQGGLVQISLRDSGPGLAPDMLEQVFEPFYSTKADGMGLGLGISQSIIKAHGGRLWLESEPGRGVTVYFALPLTVARERP